MQKRLGICWLAWMAALGVGSSSCATDLTDTTQVCESCVPETPEERAGEAAGRAREAARREALESSRYAFLKEATLSESEIAAAWQALPYERLGLTRTECFADCPEYSFVFIRASGGDTRARALYEGLAGVPDLGLYEGSLSLRQYAELCLLTDRLGLLELAAEYRAPWPGDATTIILVRHSSGEHQVVDYGRQGPPELIALELAFDGAAANITWQPLPAEDADGAPDPQDGIAEK